MGCAYMWAGETEKHVKNKTVPPTGAGQPL